MNGFDRPNISLRVDMFSSKSEKYDAVLRRVEFAEKPGIVYVSTHRNAETLAADLQRNGVKAAFYHGGLKPKQREEIQSLFMKDELPVIVATNAFGMSMDKPDIRFVYHADVSDSLEGYVQEIGLAGHDGMPAEAVLFFRLQDINAQQYKTGGGTVDPHALELVAQALASHQSHATRDELASEASVSGRKLTNILQKLEECGAARRLDNGDVEGASSQTIVQIAEAAALQQQQLKELRRRRLEQMKSYAESRTCRRQFLLRYFGADPGRPCGNCDRCEQAGIRAARVEFNLVA